MRFEEALLLRTGAAHGLGVPLDAEQPPRGEILGLDGLDDPIRGAARNDQPIGEVPYPLMMIRVHLCRPAAHDLGDVRALADPYLVRGLPLGGVLPVLEQVPVPLRWKVLVERPAECHRKTSPRGGVNPTVGPRLRA